MVFLVRDGNGSQSRPSLPGHPLSKNVSSESNIFAEASLVYAFYYVNIPYFLFG